MPPSPIAPVAPLAPVAAPAAATARPGPAAAASAPSPPGAGNPSAHFDPSVGLVVLAFHDAAGAVSHTIPSAEQLQAYRRWEQTQLGPNAGGQKPGGAAAPPIPTPPL
jgi:hypothetical protein